MLAFLMLLAADDAATMIARAKVALSAERRCAAATDGADILVCGKRDADRFRVPFVVHDAGDPRYQSVGAERESLLHRTTPVQDMGPFLVGGGMAGVTATIGADGGVTPRTLAP